MHITRLLLVRSGTYNDMALRPYTTHVDGSTINLFREATQGGTFFEDTALSPVAGSILRPSTMPVGSVSIANGWAVPRFRFIMEIHHTVPGGLGKNVQYVSGYTDHAEVTYQGTLDPNMRFFINTSIMTREVEEMTPFGRRTRRTMADASHILNGSFNPSTTSHTQAARTMRPEDVFGEVGASVLGDVGDVFDLRSSFAGGAKKSRVSNSATPTYLSRVMNSYNMALQEGGYDDDIPSLMRKARNDSQEGLIANDLFLNNLQRNTSFSEGTSVSYSELCLLSPDLDNITIVANKEAVVQTNNFAPSTRGSAAYWEGVDNNTIFATIIAQSFPAIMMDSMITEAAIGFTNKTMDGQFHLEFLAEPLSFIADRDLTAQLAGPMLRHFETKILRDLTQSNMISIEGSVYCAVTGETKIRIAAADEALTDYVAPAFCDALSAPVITNNAENLRNLASDLSTLVDNVAQQPASMGFAGAETLGGFDDQGAPAALPGPASFFDHH